jgi:hypothetical protein
LCTVARGGAVGRGHWSRGWLRYATPASPANGAFVLLYIHTQSNVQDENNKSNRKKIRKITYNQFHYSFYFFTLFFME